MLIVLASEMFSGKKSSFSMRSLALEEKAMSITAKELAAQLHLSESAISLALNNKPGVSRETRKRVLEAAREQGLDADSHKYPMSANGKSLLSHQERGFIKVVYEKESHRLLGAHLMCARASDLISEMTQALVRGSTLEELASVIRPHPTFSEGFSEALTLA